MSSICLPAETEAKTETEAKPTQWKQDEHHLS